MTDITYLRTTEGQQYVAAEMDIYSRRIIGCDIAPNLATKLLGSALKSVLVTQRGPHLREWLYHGDCGASAPPMSSVTNSPATRHHPEREPCKQLLRQRRH